MSELKGDQDAAANLRAALDEDDPGFASKGCVRSC
jgi:hypothetical protein